jgi:hypothetical protein
MMVLDGVRGEVVAPTGTGSGFGPCKILEGCDEALVDMILSMMWDFMYIPNE